MILAERRETSRSFFLDFLGPFKGGLGMVAAIYILYVLGWRLVPSFTMVNLILGKYEGNLLHVGIVEASISLATVTATYISGKLLSSAGLKAMTISTLVVMSSLAVVYLTPPFAFLAATAYMLRMGDALWFIFSPGRGCSASLPGRTRPRL